MRRWAVRSIYLRQRLFSRSFVLPIYYRLLRHYILKTNKGVEVLLIDIVHTLTVGRSSYIPFTRAIAQQKEMAVASEIEIHKAEDGVVAVRRDVIVDPELGIAAEVEKVVAAVDVGGGKVALLEKTKVTGVKEIPNQVRSIC